MTTSGVRSVRPLLRTGWDERGASNPDIDRRPGTSQPGRSGRRREAARSARNYLVLMAFSRSGLIEQLRFEGYSREQAAYGVAQAGL